MSAYVNRSDVFNLNLVWNRMFYLKIQIPVNKADFALQEAVFFSVKITHLHHKLDFLD